MQLLFLLFFGTNFFLTYVFNCFNGVMFNIRTRGLNSAIYFLRSVSVPSTQSTRSLHSLNAIATPNECSRILALPCADTAV